MADARRLVHERRMSWFPPPLSRFEGLRRLLPSQSLDLATGELIPRALMPEIALGADPEAAMERVAAQLSTALARLSARAEAEGEPVWLGLTAGKDSRAVLALAARAGAQVRPHTRLTPRMSVADRVLPPALARAAGYAHEVHRDRPLEGSREALLEAHAAGAVSVGDAWPFLSGARDALTGVLIGGHVFEVATGVALYRRLPAEEPAPADGVRTVLDLLWEPPGSDATAGVAAWFDWARRTPVAHLDWRDRLYLEQRHGGWFADKEQVFDMQDVARVPLLNCAATTALMLGLDRAFRASGGPQRALVALAAPALARFPVNPPDRRFLASHPGAVLRRRAHGLGVRLGRRIAGA